MYKADLTRSTRVYSTDERESLQEAWGPEQYN